MALIDDLAARLKETTDELEAEIIDRHGSNPQFYEYSRRKFDRDMTSVRAARKLLADYEADKGRDVDLTPGTVAYANLPEGTIIPQPTPLLGARLTDDQEKEWGDAPPAKPAPSTPQLDALLCELGALGVRLDVLHGK
jgi:hypothetical protein